MKKILLKVFTILLAFVAGIVVTSYLYNKGNLDMTAYMAEATLPILYFADGNEHVNPTYGYTSEIDVSGMRSSVMPLNEERNLQIVLEKYNAEIQSVSFEVRSIDMERLIQNGEVENLKEEGSYVIGNVKIKDLLEDTEEYLLIFHVELENYQDVQYFTRIANCSETLVDACVNFAYDFHNATLDPNNDYPITQFLETDTARKENSLAYIDIHSKYRNVIWDHMPVKQSVDPTVTYLELENDVVALKMDYQVTFENESGELESYQVMDYFRIRQTNIRMYLLDYERRAERIFFSDSQVFEKNSLKIGMQWDELNYMVNEEGSVLNFVISDELWSYDIAQNKLSKVFSFKSGNDKRGLHDEFEIQLINMEDSGSMDFLVKGYMNRGLHEGETGAAVMRYDSLTNTTEELLFIESSECAEVLIQTVGELLYISYDDKMYLSCGGDIVTIDLNTKNVETLTEDLSAGAYMISQAGDMIAWRHGNDRFSSTKITTMDMKSGMRYTYTAESGEYIRPLGFVGEHFFFGACAEADVAEDFAGNTLFPMYRVEIRDTRGSEIREFNYLEKNKYILSAIVQNNRIDLQCVTKNADGSYSETLGEPITSSVEEKKSTITLAEEKHAVKKDELIFRFKTDAVGKRKEITPKQVLFEEDRNIVIERGGEERFYAYAKGNICGVYAKLRDAIVASYSQMGVVTDYHGKVVWERGSRRSRSVLELASGIEPVDAEDSLEGSLKVLLEQEGIYTDVRGSLDNGRSLYQILKQNSQKKPENFTGCNLSSVLYYVSEGNYILAMTDAHSAELIVGYDAQNIYVLNVMTGKMNKEGQKDAAARYEKCGNVFFSFLE